MFKGLKSFLYVSCRKKIYKPIYRKFMSLKKKWCISFLFGLYSYRIDLKNEY
jgi:hypothetical protein